MRALTTLTLTLTTMLAAACGRADDDASKLAAPQPNLRFVGSSITLATSGGALVVEKGATVTVGCNVSSFRASYRYGNGGPVAAAAHSNVSLTNGGSNFTFGQAALASGAVRSAWASFGAVVTPNVPTLIGIRLDGTGLVGESNELDNAWFAYVVRKCP